MNEHRILSESVSTCRCVCLREYDTVCDHWSEFRGGRVRNIHRDDHHSWNNKEKTT